MIAAVVLTGLVGAACTTRVSTSTTSTVPEITATSSTSLPDPVSSSTSSLPTVHAVDLTAAFRAAPVGEPIEVIELPWGDRPGEVGFSAVFGPCCFDVAPDGGIVIEDTQNLRYQYFDGERWEILASYGRDEPIPDGVAVLESGLVALVTVSRGDPTGGLASRTVTLVRPDGTVVDRGRVPVNINQEWFGHRDLWSMIDATPRKLWVRATVDGKVAAFDETVLDELGSLIDQRLTSGEPPYPLDVLFDLGVEDRLIEGTRTVIIERTEGRYIGDPSAPWQVTWSIDGNPITWRLDDDEAVAGGGIFLPTDETIAIQWSHVPTDDGTETHLFGFAHPDGTMTFLEVPLAQWMEVGPFNTFRIHQGRLYVLQTYRDAARIEIYELGGAPN